MNTAKQLVIEILQENPRARNSDKEMYITYFRKIGIDLTKEQTQIFCEMPFDLETLRRTRQVIQNDEKRLEASEVIKKARRIKEADIREKRLKRQWIFNPDTQTYREE